MGRHKAGHLGKNRQQSRGRARPGQERTAELPQEQDQRCLARFIGQLPVPGAGRVRAAKDALHLNAQAKRVDRRTLRQIGLQRFGHAQDRSSRIEGRDGGNRRKRALGRKMGEMGHRETPE